MCVRAFVNVCASSLVRAYSVHIGNTRARGGVLVRRRNMYEFACGPGCSGTPSCGRCARRRGEPCRSGTGSSPTESSPRQAPPSKQMFPSNSGRNIRARSSESRHVSHHPHPTTPDGPLHSNAPRFPAALISRPDLPTQFPALISRPDFPPSFPALIFRPVPRPLRSLTLPRARALARTRARATCARNPDPSPPTGGHPRSSRAASFRAGPDRAGPGRVRPCTGHG